MLKAVFFDLYGTLAGFQPSRYDIQSRACADFGITLTPEGVLRGYALADAYMARQNALAPVRNMAESEKRQFFAEYERLVLKGSGVEVTTEQAEAIWRRVRQERYDLMPFDDVRPTLTALRERGLVVGMISNMNRPAKTLAEDLGLAPYLDFAVTSLEVGAEKPDPRIFHAALSKAAVQAGEAMHIGDQPASDVDGARAAGIAPVLLDRDRNHLDFTACPRIESLSELTVILGGMVDTQQKQDVI